MNTHTLSLQERQRGDGGRDSGKDGKDRKDGEGWTSVCNREWKNNRKEEG